MSKQNKVNPGQYTQAGRLTPDDTARELAKQREMGSPAKTDGKAQPHRAAPSSVTDEDNTDVEEQDDDNNDDEQDEEQEPEE